MIRDGVMTVESRHGIERRFASGDVLWLAGLGVRRLRNDDDAPCRVARIRRTRSKKGTTEILY